MSSSPQSKPTGLSLRERKKLETHLAIQGEALRLFKKQGYEATTVEQIAEAAEVSQTTFFRYFGSKQDVVLHDALDPLAMAALEAQPAELTPIEALRQAMREVYLGLSPEELAAERERQALIRATPELWTGMLTDVTGALGMFAMRLRGARDARPTTSPCSPWPAPSLAPASPCGSAAPAECHGQITLSSSTLPWPSLKRLWDCSAH